ASFVVIPFAGTIVKKIGKKETAVLGAIIPTVIYVGMLFIPNLTALLYIILSFVAGLGSGLINTIIWALVEETQMVNLKVKPYNLDEESIRWVEDTIANMSIEEKIGQLFVNMGSSRDE
ncbi:MFS transporter, partial [Clostridioides difficile]|uniref:MFS transporter n=1 Tax=Clostridioides difficile TaxID=1496 RepID=UPI002E8DE642